MGVRGADLRSRTLRSMNPDFDLGLPFGQSWFRSSLRYTWARRGRSERYGPVPPIGSNGSRRRSFLLDVFFERLAICAPEPEVFCFMSFC